MEDNKGSYNWDICPAQPSSRAKSRFDTSYALDPKTEQNSHFSNGIEINMSKKDYWNQNKHTSLEDEIASDPKIL